MRRALILAALAAACGGKKQDAPAAADKAIDAGAAAVETPAAKYGVFRGGTPAPLIQGHAPTVAAMLDVLATRQAALAPARAAISMPRRGFVAPPPIEDQGDFRVVNESTQTGEMHLSLVEYMSGFAQALNTAFKLPRDIPIRMRPCGQPNLFYDLEAQEIHVCDEAMPFMISVFARYRDEQHATVAGLVAVIGGFFHELGHCLIHQFELPAIGREEDAADEFATLFLLGGPDLPDEQRNIEFALTAAEFWMALGLVRNQDSRARLWDEHSLDEVRYYGILCLTYGVAPNVAGFLVDDGDLPAERAQKCPVEYKQKHRSWKMLLTPYMHEGVPF